LLVGGTLGVAIAASSLAAERPRPEAAPTFYLLANEAENSALSMDCEGKAPFESISCTFTQVSVSIASEDYIAKQRAELTKQAAAEAVDRPAACKIGAQTVPEGAVPARTAAAGRFIKAMDKACKCPDDACFRSQLVELFVAEERVCRVHTNTFHIQLDRILGTRRWANTSKPSLTCAAVDYTLVESDDTGSKWKFTQTRLTSDDDFELCRHLAINKPSVFSSSERGAALLNCELVDFRF
jgi:hypothetical protein